jgi:hypothetical protein
VRSAWPVYVEVGKETIGFGTEAAGDAACTIGATNTDDDIDNDEILLGADTVVGPPDGSVTDPVEDSVPVSPAGPTIPWLVDCSVTDAVPVSVWLVDCSVTDAVPVSVWLVDCSVTDAVPVSVWLVVEFTNLRP